MCTRDMAANWILVISMAPSSVALSSPRRPWDKLTSTILPWSMASSILNELFLAFTTSRTRGDDTNCPTLLRIGAIASWRCLSCMRLNSYSQKLRRMGSSSSSTNESLNLRLVNMSKISDKRAVLLFRSVNNALRRMYSRRGPQE